MKKDPALVAEGAKVTAMREALNLSPREFADALKCKCVTLRNAESGNARLGARRFQAAMRMVAERTGRPVAVEGGVVAQAYEHYGGTAARQRMTARDVDITEVLRLSRSDAVKAAAAALAVATGISEEEAMAEVIRVGLNRRD
jgi:transcriptional regulator with XRE-family HTH domain